MTSRLEAAVARAGLSAERVAERRARASEAARRLLPGWKARPLREGAEDWLLAWQGEAHPETGEEVGRWYLPTSVARCLTRSWAWIREMPGGELVVTPYECGSWRCPFCAWKPAVDLCERLQLTLKPRDARELTFLTLTVPRRGVDPFELMHELSGMTRALFKRLRYDLGHGAGRARRRTACKYALVFEAHADPRWLHAHAVVWCPRLAERLRERGWFLSRNELKGRDERRYRYAVTDLQAMARDVGLGRIDAQPVDSPEALARYFAKLSREMAGAHKKGQLPLLAPPRFRRIRATPGFLQKLERRAVALSTVLANAPKEAVEAALESGDERVSSCLDRLAREARKPRWRRPREPARIAASP